MFNMFVIMIFTADHPEGQEITATYANACRVCIRQKNNRGEYILRSTDDAVNNFQRMMYVVKTQSKSQAFQISKSTQQHIYDLPQWYLGRLHLPYLSAPFDPGHSEDQGLFMKHLYWTLRKWVRTKEDKEKKLPKLDPSHSKRNEFDRRIRNFSKWSGIRHWTYQSISDFAKKKNPVKLTAFDFQSLRCIVLFAFCDLIDEKAQERWKQHLLYASSFQRKNWRRKNIERLHKHSSNLLQQMTAEFPDRMAKLTPKLHDPNHAAMFVELYADSDNWSAMLMESVHKFAKGEAPNTNHKELLEHVLIERVRLLFIFVLFLIFFFCFLFFVFHVTFITYF
jgi:hypothetical protein